MTRCLICNRRLTNPFSVAAGIGPICGNRQYKSRVYARHGSRGGWKDLLAWEKYATPCYSCKSFLFPKKGAERTTSEGHIATIDGKEIIFRPNAIGGSCRKLKQPVDGNEVKLNAACAGAFYESRRKDHEQPKTGVYQYADGQLALFEI